MSNARRRKIDSRTLMTTGDGNDTITTLHFLLSVCKGMQPQTNLRALSLFYNSKLFLKREPLVISSRLEMIFTTPLNCATDLGTSTCFFLVGYNHCRAKRSHVVHRFEAITAYNRGRIWLTGKQNSILMR